MNKTELLGKIEGKFLIVDARGDYLSNKICETFQLKHFEKRVDLLIASEDLTVISYCYYETFTQSFYFRVIWDYSIRV